MNVYKDKVVVITGAGGVLCSMMAKEYAKLGAKVAVLDLNLAAAQKVADEIVAEGGVAKAYAVNCLEKESMEKAKSSINAELGLTDILINGAGGNNPKGTTSHDYFSEADMKDPDVKSFFDLDGNGVDFVFKLNFLATFLTTQVFAKDMVGRGGNIINVSSMNAFRPLTRIPAYSGAKASVSNFTEWLAVHFAKEGIRVNAIAPGIMRTPLTERRLSNPDDPVVGKWLANTPMGRVGTPDELVGIALYFACDASSFTTGATLPVDGGYTCW